MEINNEPIFAKLNVRAFELGMDALKKLDKIEQIIKDHDNDKMPEDYWYIDKIREVLEDDK